MSEGRLNVALAADLIGAARRRVLYRAVLRSVAIAFLIAAGLFVALIMLDLFVPLSGSVRRVLRWLPGLLLFGPIVHLVRVRTSLSDARLALLLDERGGQGNVLSTLQAPNTTGRVAKAFQLRAVAAIRAVDVRAVIPLDAGRLWLGCIGIAVLVAGIVTLAAPRASLTSRWVNAEDAPERSATSGPDSAEEDVLPSLGTIEFTVRPPAYSGVPVLRGSAGEALSALPGSVIEVRGSGSARTPVLSAAVVGGGVLTPRSGASGWTVVWTVRPDDRGLTLSVEEGNETLERRVLPLRLLRDRPPTVSLETPPEDLVLASASGRIPVRVQATDDFGVASLELHWVLSRGSGESFDFEEGTWEWDAVTPASSGQAATRSLVLDDLGLEAGDVLHVRAVATDGNDVTGPGIGVSQTRQIRISREDDLSDVTTIIGFPIERDREPLLSQRMIILLTEELIDSAGSLSPDARLEASADIADEQARLRARIGEQIFSRATGAMQDPEAHLDFEEGEAEVFLDELEAAAAQGPVIDPETGMASIANVDIPAHEHDSDPIVAINRSLLTVYNYMWDAERQLRAAQLDRSLVPQNLALDELQRVRDSERVFARGRVAAPPIDVPAARGTGDLDGASPGSRRGATPANGVDRRVAADIGTLLALSGPLGSPLTGRLISIEISGLALDLLSAGEEPESGELLSEAAARAQAGDAVGTEEALRRALRLLRGSEMRATLDLRGPPTSLASARFAVSDVPAAPASVEGSESAPFVFATVRYESGDWDSAPLVPTNLIHSLAQYTDLPVEPEGVIVDLDSPEIFDFPFLYLTGHLPVFFGEAEARNLVDFVERGGMIFVDDHNHDIDGAFHRSVTTELQRLFGSTRLTPIPNDHELYSSFFEFEDGPPITGHELSGWGDGLIHRELYQVEVAGRIGVLYSNKDYSSEWSYHSENKRFLAVDNTQFGVNILVYALTR